MSPIPRERVEQVRSEITTALKDNASPVFLNRVNAVLEDWASEKLTAAEACEKVQKMVTLFIGEDKAREIGMRCAPIVMRESASSRK
jgi:hypothetical protein